MITLRLSIDDINSIYKALTTDEQYTILAEKIKLAAEKDVSSWDGYVINEVNSLLDVFVPEAANGNIGVKYNKPIKEKYETGPVYDENKATSVNISVILTFNSPIDISTT